MKIRLTPKIFLEQLLTRLRNRTFSLTLIGFFIIFLQVIYIYLRYKYINSEIPLWFTLSWGDYWLAPKAMIYIIPALSFGIFLIGFGLILINRYYIKYFYELVWGSVVFCLVFLSFSIVRIIGIASVPFEPLIDPDAVPLLIPFAVSFFVTNLVLPYFIDYAQSKKIITNPSIHEHPGMVLRAPSARGGGVLYGAVVLVLAGLFVGFSRDFSGLYVSILMITVLGVIDDFQNTHPSSNLKVFENPFLRLFLLFLSVLPSVLSGIQINEISNPFGPVLRIYDIWKFLPFLFTAVWIVWVMNVMSWSNGIDGQYSGIVGISSLAIAFLALRFDPIQPFHFQVATIAAVSAGSAFGFTKYNWHPSKIMWGFGAMTAGLVISVLSISVKAKIVASILIILVPFMDAVVTVIRRIVKKKNPLSGDKGHLHHLLLERGWSPQKISLFYWFTTALFGIIGLMTPEKYSLQAALIVTGIVAFMIILLNLKSGVNRKQTQ